MVSRIPIQKSQLVKATPKKLSKPSTKKQPKASLEKEPNAVPKDEAKKPRRPYNFKPFSRLPLELRNMIWAFAASQPRLIRATWSSQTDGHGFSTLYTLATSSFPGTIHTCRESRTVALKHFRQVPKEVVFGGSVLKGKKYGLWINFHADTFYFTNFPERAGFLKTLRRLKACEGGLGVRSIAFSTKELWRLLECLPSQFNPRKVPALIYDVVQEQQALREIVVVAGDMRGYAADTDPGKYNLYPLKKPYQPLKHKNLGKREPPEIIPKAFDCGDPMPKTAKEKFERFTSEHAMWREPDFSYMKVLKK